MLEPYIIHKSVRWTVEWEEESPYVRAVYVLKLFDEKNSPKIHL